MNTPRKLAFVLALAVFSGPAIADPVKTHPRILFRAEDMQNLRDRMVVGNPVWTTFKAEIVDKCMRDYKCSATSHYTGAPNYQWIRDSFTDENGVTHLPGDSDWDSIWKDQTGRPACPEDDDGNGSSYTRVNSEQYAMIFALMARLLKDQGQETLRNEYLNAAKDCLFHVIDHAKNGHPAPDAEGHYPPFQHIGFAVDDRSFSAESFAFAVDWIYEDLSADELAKVRKAFLVWAQDCNDHIYFAPTNPHGTPNSPSLLRQHLAEEQRTRAEIRLGLNNHYTNHLREMVLYALAMDPKDDIPNATHNDSAIPGSLTSHIISGSPTNWLRQQYGVLFDSLSVWQYIADYALRNDGQGGLSVEGTQYASNGLGPLALMLAALNSAGQDDVRAWGPQANVAKHPFWSKTIPGYLSMLTPTSRVPTGPNLGYLGEIYQPPLSGDLENFLAINDQYIKVLAPMALVDARVNGNSAPTAQAVRYIQQHLAPGGTARFTDRIRETRGSTALRDAVYYFLLFDPSAPTASDPRPALQPKTFFAQHTVNDKLMGMALGRSGYSASDTYFFWRLDWNRIDHQRGDSLGFGLWKNGLWLTKGMTGYGILQGCADYRNSLSLQNGVPTSSPVGESLIAEHGSQWDYSPIGDPEITERSTGDSFLYFTGDATNLYTHQSQTTLREVTHASRSIVWLKPDHVIVYDRATSKSAGFYKKFFLNVPRDPVITGNVARSSAMEGAVEKGRLFITSLLPASATIQWKTINDGQPAGGIDSNTGRPSQEDMWAQIFVEAPGQPQDARFLHVVQGTNAGVTSADTAAAITSSDGEFEGSVVGTRCIVFRKTLNSAPTGLSYTHPAGMTAHYITGLAPFTGYNITQTSTSVSVTPGTQRFTDGGGVLVLGGVEVPNVEITATDNTGSESGDTISFTLKRSGDPSTSLDVALSINTTLSTATAADLTSLPSSVSFSSSETTKTITLTPFDDALFEGSETLVLSLIDGAGYHVAEVSAEAEATLTDNDSPPGGTFALSATTYTVNENVAGGKALITLQRSGGTTGSIDVTCTATAGTATDGVQFVAGGSTLTFADGETSKTFEVTILNNAIYHGDKTVIITISQVSGLAQIGTPSTAALTILDDEPAPVGDISFATTSYSKAEGDPSFTITLRRLNGTGGNVSATIAAQGGSTALAGSDYTISPTTVNWADHDGADKVITFTVIDDSLYEGGSESVTLGLTSFTGGVTAGSPATTTVTIADNDSQPSVLEVGPGKDRTSLADVSWSNLVAGSTVLVYPKPGGYHERVQLSASGTASEPIRIIGVTVNGDKPLLDGANATTPASLQFASFEFVESAALWTVRRRSSQASSVKPSYLVIENFAFTNTGPSQTYLDTSSNAQNYSSTGAALFIAGAEHITVRKCSFTNSHRGVSVRSGSTENDISRDVLVERCTFTGNSPSNGNGCNVLGEAIGFTLQFCDLNRPAGTSSGAVNISEASAGSVIRCNRIEGGGYLLYGPDPKFNFAPISSLYNDPAFQTSHVYGNVFINGPTPPASADFGTDNSTVIQIGDIFGTAGSTHRTGTMHFLHNSIVVNSQRSSTTLFSFSEPQATVKASNNIVHCTQALGGGITLNFAKYHGSYTLGTNWFRTGLVAGPGDGTMTGFGNAITGTEPQVTWTTGALQNTSPCINAATALPSGAQAIDVQYASPASGVARVMNGPALDLGALENAADVSPFAEWLFSWFGVAGDPLADSDHDGADNLMEYALGLNPLAPNPDWLPSVALTEGHLVMTVTRNPDAIDVIFTIEVSDDLSFWQSGAPHTTVLQETSATLQVRDEAAGPRRFIRLRVTK